MARGVPLDPELIERIRGLATAGKGREAIVRELGVSRGSVDKYAPPGSFDRTATAAAVKAQQIDAAARRAAQQQRYLDIVDELQERAVAEYEHAQPAGADGEIRRWTTVRPPARETADLMRAATAASNAELRLADYKARDNHDDAREVVLSFGLAVRSAQLPDDEPAGGA